MNAKELKEYNLSRQQYHRLLANRLGRPVVQHILHKARKIQSLYRLDANDTEEIEQELSIVASKAQDTWTKEMDANKTTFVLGAVNNHSAYLARQLSGLPITENYDSGTDIKAIGRLHKFVQENARKIYDKNHAMYPAPKSTDPKEQKRLKRIQRKDRPKVKPSVVSCGAELDGQAVSRPLCHSSLKFDMEAVFTTLIPRQQLIVLMLRDGHTQEEIAEALGLAQQRISEQIQRIQKKFQKLLE